MHVLLKTPDNGWSIIKYALCNTYVLLYELTSKGIKSKRKLYCIFTCIYYEILVLKKNNFFSKLILFNKINLNFWCIFMKVYVEYLSSLRRRTETPLLITCPRPFIFTDKTRAGWPRNIPCKFQEH